jgi:hypothetical protein
LIPIDDTQKLKEIFKSKKIKIEISDQPLLKFVKKIRPKILPKPGIYANVVQMLSIFAKNAKNLFAIFVKSKKGI